GPVVLRPAPPSAQRLLTGLIRRVELLLADLVSLPHVRVLAVGPQVEAQPADTDRERLVPGSLHSLSPGPVQGCRDRLSDVRALTLLYRHGTSLGCVNPVAARAAPDQRDGPVLAVPHVQV